MIANGSQVHYSGESIEIHPHQHFQSSGIGLTLIEPFEAFLWMEKCPELSVNKYWYVPIHQTRGMTGPNRTVYLILDSIE